MCASSSALDARLSPHAELGTAHRAGISTTQLVWLDSRAERTRSAFRLRGGGWRSVLKSRSPVEMWSDSSGVQHLEKAACFGLRDLDSVFRVPIRCFHR